MMTASMVTTTSIWVVTISGAQTTFYGDATGSLRGHGGRERGVSKASGLPVGRLQALEAAPWVGSMRRTAELGLESPKIER